MKPSVNLSNKFVESVKQGFNDIKLVMEEGNYNCSSAVCGHYCGVSAVPVCRRGFAGKIGKYSGADSAIEAQFTMQNEYMASKQKLLELEPRFPDVSAKNDWLLRQIVAVFRDSNVTPTLGSAQAEDTSNSGYTVAGIPVTMVLRYGDFGRLLANIENKKQYLRVFRSYADQTGGNQGQNESTIRINTIFPQEKIAAKMFKDAREERNDKLRLMAVFLLCFSFQPLWAVSDLAPALPDLMLPAETQDQPAAPVAAAETATPVPAPSVPQKSRAAKNVRPCLR